DLYTVLAHPFDVLYRREPEINVRCLKAVQECLSNPGKGIRPVGVPAHTMQEHFARNNKVFRIEPKWLSPVYSKITGKVMGVLVTQKAHILGTSNVTGIGFVSC